MALWAVNTNPTELRSNATEDELQTVIRAAYKQVFGNRHLMEGDRLTSAESMLRNGDINVRQFVNALAQSDLYRSLFFESASQYRFIELNFKHLLGRAPQDQAEISEHVRIYAEGGYEAEIDSYIDSDEYRASFGDNTVPYLRSTQTQTGLKNVAFNRTFAISRGAASSDKSNRAKLIGDLGQNLPTKITAPVGGGSASPTNKRFRITASKAGGASVKRGTISYEVGYKQLSQKIQSIHRTGGKILSVTEVA
jgi:Phycobilisome Linker polypeptide/CpcD/allophycocyanin linker domain